MNKISMFLCGEPIQVWPYQTSLPLLAFQV